MTPSISSIRRELEETALVRPSNLAEVLDLGSAGSTTIALMPLESSAAARVSPTSPPPKMMTSARSIGMGLATSGDQIEVAARPSAACSRRSRKAL